MRDEVRVLLVEDNPGDVLLTCEHLREVPAAVEVVRDGKQVLPHLRGSAGLPHLLVLDLNLPGMDGRAVLVALQQDPALRALPVIVFTGSGAPADAEFARGHGARYLRKDAALDGLRELCQCVTALREARGAAATAPPERAG